MVGFLVVLFIGVAFLVIVPCWLSRKEEKDRQRDEWVQRVVETQKRKGFII